MKRVKPVVAALVAAITVCGTSVYAAGENGVLVVPARYTVVQLGFDIVALRNATLISYEKSDGGKDPVLYVWDNLASAWESLSVDEYLVGSFSRDIPKEMILVGSERDLPAVIIEGASQAEKVTRIDTLNVADIVNRLNKSMKFSPPEWKALANKHGFSIKDRNEDRRRWGRYGPPGTKKQAPKKAEKEEINIFSDSCNAEDSAKDSFKTLENELKVPGAESAKHLEIPADDKPLPENQAIAAKAVEVDQPVPDEKPKTADEIEFPEDK